MVYIPTVHHDQSSPMIPSDGLSLAELVSELRRRWLTVMLTTVAVIGLACLYMRIATPVYRATLIVAPAAKTGEMTSALGKIASMASAVGVALPSGIGTDDSPFPKYLQTLTGESVAARLLDQDELTHLLFQDAWDSEAKEWRLPGSPAVRLQDFLQRLFKQTGWLPPSLHSISEFLIAYVGIVQDDATGLTQLTFDHADGAFAARLLEFIHRNGEDLLRAQAHRAAVQQIEYLRKRLHSTTVAEHRAALTQLLSDQERTLMTLEANQPYAAERLEPARISSQPVAPKPLLILVLALFGGLFLGITIAMVRIALRHSASRLAAESTP